MIFFVMAVVVAGQGSAAAQVVTISHFDPSGVGGLCGIGFDSTRKSVWVQGCSTDEVRRYEKDGTFVSSVPRPGESANDVDVEFSSVAFVLGSTPVSPGTLLSINGETGAAEVYAVDTSSGVVVETLVTNFGVSHVVGGGHHPTRDSLFLVQDRVPGSPPGNRIAELDAVTGLETSSFDTLPDFDVNFGDLDVCASTGHLLVVSSMESNIGEFDPNGSFLGDHALPPGVSSLSGIAIDDTTGEAWVSGTAGLVYQLGGLPCSQAATPVPALSHGALLVATSLLILLTVIHGAARSR